MSNTNDALSFDPEYFANKGKRKNRFESLKPGSVVYRILPSTNPANKDFSHTWNSHFLQIPGTNGTSVLCTLYTAERYCPICERKKEVDVLSTRAKESGDKEKVKELAEVTKTLSRNRKVYYNAVNAGTGELVVLQLSKTASDDLESKIYKAFTDLKMDALSLKNGLWFKFTRSGMGFDTVVEVEFLKKSTNENGEIVERYDRSALSEEMLAQINAGLCDLSNSAGLGMKSLPASDLGAFLRGEAVTLPGRGTISGGSQTQGQMRPTLAQATQAVPAVQAPTPTVQSSISIPTAATDSVDEMTRLKKLASSIGKVSG